MQSEYIVKLNYTICNYFFNLTMVAVIRKEQVTLIVGVFMVT